MEDGQGLRGVYAERRARAADDEAARERPHLVPVHFRETLHETVQEGEPGTPAMTFDYRLRPGLATTTNALELLRLVGL